MHFRGPSHMALVQPVVGSNDGVERCVFLSFMVGDRPNAKIVEFLAERWRQHSHTVELCDAAHLPRAVDPADFDAWSSPPACAR